MDPAGHPAWVKQFGDTVCACFNEIEGSTAGFDYRYSGPGEQAHDDHLFLFAPQPLEVEGGPDDGEIVCDPLTVDIQAVQELFTELDSTTFNAARGDSWHLRCHVAVSGHVGQRSITVYIFDEPFDDAEIRMVLDDKGPRYK